MSTHLVKGSKCPAFVNDKIRLYTNKFCPYAERIHLILDAKDISYDAVYINLNSLPEWFIKKVPTGKVPAIEFETGEIIYDSIIIAQYIDEKYPNKKLLSKDCLDKANELMLIEYFNGVISAMNNIILSFGRHRIEQEQTIKKGLEIFEKELSNRGTFYKGNKPGLVDYFLWPWAERSNLLKLFRTSVDLRKENFKNIMKWYENMLENDAVKKNIIDIDTHTRFFQTYCSGVPCYDIA